MILGRANDRYPHSDIEIRLAGFIASAANRDPEDVQIIEEIMGLAVDGDAVDLLQEGCIDVALDRIAEREARPRRPRNAVETMVDRACGIEIMDDGTVVEIGDDS